MGAPGLDRSTALAALSGWSPALPDQTQPTWGAHQGVSGGE